MWFLYMCFLIIRVYDGYNFGFDERCLRLYYVLWSEY